MPVSSLSICCSRRSPVRGPSRETRIASQRTHAQSHGQACPEAWGAAVRWCRSSSAYAPARISSRLTPPNARPQILRRTSAARSTAVSPSARVMLEALLENIRVLALDASKLVCVPVQADSLAAYAKARAGFSASSGRCRGSTSSQGRSMKTPSLRHTASSTD